MVRLPLAVLAVVIAAGVMLGVPTSARAADWCGTVATTERPSVFGGQQVRVWYAIASDTPDNSASQAPVVSRAVDTIADWWLLQDAERTPRFALTPFACGPQTDLRLLRLPQPAAALQPTTGRFSAIATAALQTEPSSALTHLVFYDGPLDDTDLCGQGGGDGRLPGVAIVYMAGCAGVPRETTAAHELLHAWGALPGSGPPHACPDSRGHPCDSQSDLLYPFATDAPLSALGLDIGRDDYYGHSGGWLDVQDSPWLKLVSRQVPVTVATSGTGTVRFDTPGGVCLSVPCTMQWNEGAEVALVAAPGQGQRLRRWTGPCAGQGASCRVAAPAGGVSIAAEFVQAAFALRVAVRGKGRVMVGSRVCTVTCSQAVESFTPVRLTAKPIKGWRFVRWTGACAGTKVTCSVPMAKPTQATAVFAKKPA